MKKFTKLMLATTAITAVSAAMAVSALAADTITGSYDGETGVVTLGEVEPSGEQQTLLVLKEDVNEITDENAGSIIAQIDQQEGIIPSFKLPKELPEGTVYYIRIGGSDGSMQTGTLTIGGSSAETITIIIGDIDRDDYNLVDADDVTALAKWTVDSKDATNALVDNVYKVVSGIDAGTITFGDIDFDDYNMVDADDVTALAKWTVDSKDATNVFVETEVTVEATPITVE